MTGDEITLSIPREEPFHEVAHLVLGGFAARLGLTFESLDDLETALDAVLERAASNGHVTVKLCLAEGSLRATVGPFPDGTLRGELERDPGDEVTLRRILDTVLDGYQLDADGWLELRKRVAEREG
ncbi:MAG: hypothetical protein E6F97_02430 [Actinobacteria bacterium]|nr:MAG: hypothetical protein E6F97_02430 [Actinomycetota bacterium]